jgi:hypothetical protein
MNFSFKDPLHKNTQYVLLFHHFFIIQIHRKKSKKMATSYPFPTITNLLDHAREAAERHERHNEELRQFIRYLRLRRASMISKPFLEKWNIQLLKADLTLEECPLCYEIPKSDQIAQFNCQHAFCVDCCVNYAKTLGNKHPVCPMCRANIEIIKTCSEEAFKSINDVHVLI